MADSLSPDVRNQRHLMYVQIQGQIGKIPLLFIHGIPVNSKMWKEQMKHFSAHHYLMAPDLPGLGKGELHFNAVTSEYYVEYLMNVIQSTGFKKMIICGHAFGGYLALRLYQLIPDLFQAMILVNTHPFSDDDHTKIKRWRAIKKLHAYRDEFLEQLYSRYIGESNKKDKNLKRFFIEELVDPNTEAGISAAIASLTGRIDCSEVLDSIKVPTLLIEGSEDKVIPHGVMRWMKDQIAISQYHCIPNCGHMSSIERPEEFNQVMENFLRNYVYEREFLYH